MKYYIHSNTSELLRTLLPDQENKTKQNTKALKDLFWYSLVKCSNSTPLCSFHPPLCRQSCFFLKSSSIWWCHFLVLISENCQRLLNNSWPFGICCHLPFLSPLKLQHHGSTLLWSSLLPPDAGPSRSPCLCSCCFCLGCVLSFLIHVMGLYASFRIQLKWYPSSAAFPNNLFLPSRKEKVYLSRTLHATAFYIIIIWYQIILICFWPEYSPRSLEHDCIFHLYTLVPGLWHIFDHL